MNSKLTGRLLAALIFQASVASAGWPTLFDTVTTHANGMPLASADPLRDGDIVNGCNRYHIGCCGGHYNTPLKRSIVDPKRCHVTLCEKRPMLSNTTPGIAPQAGLLTPAFDGMDTVQVELIGAGPNSAPPVSDNASPEANTLASPAQPTLQDLLNR